MSSVCSPFPLGAVHLDRYCLSNGRANGGLMGLRQFAFTFSLSFLCFSPSPLSFRHSTLLFLKKIGNDLNKRFSSIFLCHGWREECSCKYKSQFHAALWLVNHPTLPSRKEAMSTKPHPPKEFFFEESDLNSCRADSLLGLILSLLAWKGFIYFSNDILYANIFWDQCQSFIKCARSLNNLSG